MPQADRRHRSAKKIVAGWLAGFAVPASVTGCSATSSAVPSAASTSTLEPTTTAPAVGRTTIPSPDASETTSLLAGLGAIDPSLADKKAVSRARNVCLQSAPGEYPTADGLSNYVQQEFQDGDTPSVSASTADAIIALVTSSSWCQL